MAIGDSSARPVNNRMQNIYGIGMAPRHISGADCSLLRRPVHRIKNTPYYLMQKNEK
jgi:hypothetical protein